MRSRLCVVLIFLCTVACTHTSNKSEPEKLWDFVSSYDCDLEKCTDAFVLRGGNTEYARLVVLRGKVVAGDESNPASRPVLSVQMSQGTELYEASFNGKKQVKGGGSCELMKVVRGNAKAPGLPTSVAEGIENLVCDPSTGPPY